MSLTQNLYKPADANPASSDVASESVRWEVAYDALGRITRFESANPAYGSASFGYDPNGNRTASTHMRAGQNTSRTYTLSANRMSGFTQTAGAAATSVVYGHNANGDLVSDGLRTYSYNAEGRLSAVTTGAGEAAPTTRYAHNALGQRVFKTEPLYAPVQEANAGWLDAFLGFIAQLWNPAAGAERLGFAFVYDEQSSLLGRLRHGRGRQQRAHRIHVPAHGRRADADHGAGGRQEVCGARRSPEHAQAPDPGQWAGGVAVGVQRVRG